MHICSSGTSEVGGEKIRNEYCPIAGRYHFKYNVNYEYESAENNNAPLTKDECNSFSSDLDNCLENGSILHLQFKQCTFEDLGNFLICAFLRLHRI